MEGVNAGLPTAATICKSFIYLWPAITNIYPAIINTQDAVAVTTAMEAAVSLDRWTDAAALLSDARSRSMVPTPAMVTTLEEWRESIIYHHLPNISTHVLPPIITTQHRCRRGCRPRHHHD